MLLADVVDLLFLDRILSLLLHLCTLLSTGNFVNIYTIASHVHVFTHAASLLGSLKNFCRQ